LYSIREVFLRNLKIEKKTPYHPNTGISEPTPLSGMKCLMTPAAGFNTRVEENILQNRNKERSEKGARERVGRIRRRERTRDDKRRPQKIKCCSRAQQAKMKGEAN